MHSIIILFPSLFPTDSGLLAAVIVYKRGADSICSATACVLTIVPHLHMRMSTKVLQTITWFT